MMGLVGCWVLLCRCCCVGAAVSLQLLGGSREGYYLTDLAHTYLTRDSQHSLVGYIIHSGEKGHVKRAAYCRHCSNTMANVAVRWWQYKLWGDLETAVVTGSNCCPCASLIHCVSHLCHTFLLPADSLLYKLWGDLETAVVTGSNSWPRAFGLDSADVFASVYSNDAAVLRFMRGMHGLCQLSAKPVLTAFDLTCYNMLVDLGGATGALAAAACELYPRMRAVVFDLPGVITKAQQHFAAAPGVQGLGDRVSWVAGDFFAESQEAGLPAGDLYVLSRILHGKAGANIYWLARYPPVDV